IFRHVRASRSWRERLRATFGHPRWRPAALEPAPAVAPVTVEGFEKYQPPIPAGLSRYALLQFLVVLAASLALLRNARSLAPGELLAGGFYIALSLGNIGGVLEARSWAGVSEAV